MQKNTSEFIPTVKTFSRKGGKSIEWTYSPTDKLVLIHHARENPFFAIGWVLNGQWYYQSLVWSVRGGKSSYYRPMIAFYRYLRKNKLTEFNIHALACSDKQFKHSGYIVGSDRYKELMAVGERLAASRAREAAIKANVKLSIRGLDLGHRWHIEALHNDSYVINELSTRIGVKTEFILVRALMSGVAIEHSTGKTARAFERDPFRSMVYRNESPRIWLNNESQTPEALVAEVMNQIKQLMNSRSDADWQAANELAIAA